MVAAKRLPKYSRAVKDALRDKLDRLFLISVTELGNELR